MRAFLLLILFPMVLLARGSEISQFHWLYLRYLHDASSLTALDQKLEAGHRSLALVKPLADSGRVKRIGGLINDPNTGQMVDSGRPSTYEVTYSGEIFILDNLSDAPPSDVRKISYGWTLNPEEFGAKTPEAVKNRLYSVWSQGGYVLMTHNSELSQRSDVISHFVIPSTWVDWLRPGLEAQQELANADQGKLEDAARSENPVIAQYALHQLAESGKLDLITFMQSISDRNDFDEVALVNAVMLAIEESSGDSDELKAAIFGLASEQSSFEKAMLYAISRHIDFPYRSPTLWMYFPSSNLLHEVSSAAEKRTIEHFPDKRFSDFVSSMNVYLLGDGDLDSKPESLSVAQSVQDPIEVKPKIEKSAESETPEPSEEPAEQSSQWWLLLIGAVVVVGGIGLMLRRKS